MILLIVASPQNVTIRKQILLKRERYPLTNVSIPNVMKFLKF